MKYMNTDWYEKLQSIHISSTENKMLKENLDEAVTSYHAEYKNNFPTPPEFMKVIDTLHDCEVVSTEWLGADFVIKVEGIEHGWLDSADIKLKNAVILKEKLANDLVWLYDELYPSKKGYELHCLFAQYGSEEVFELIADCENIEIPLKD